MMKDEVLIRVNQQPKMKIICYGKLEHQHNHAGLGLVQGAELTVDRMFENSTRIFAFIHDKLVSNEKSSGS